MFWLFFQGIWKTCQACTYLISTRDKPNRHFILSRVRVSLSNAIGNPKDEAPLAMNRGISRIVFLEQFIRLSIKLIWTMINGCFVHQYQTCVTSRMIVSWVTFFSLENPGDNEIGCPLFYGQKWDIDQNGNPSLCTSASEVIRNFDRRISVHRAAT